MNEYNNIAEIVENGNELETLRALQMKLARTIDASNSGRDIAALSRQLQTVTGRIRELEALEAQSDNVLDQIIAKHRGQTVRTLRGQRIGDTDEQEDEIQVESSGTE